MASKPKPMPTNLANASRPGLTKLVGSPFRVKQIQDGEEKLKCPHCKRMMHPIFSLNGNINCSVCEAFLHRGK